MSKDVEDLVCSLYPVLFVSHWFCFGMDSVLAEYIQSISVDGINSQTVISLIDSFLQRRSNQESSLIITLIIW